MEGEEQFKKWEWIRARITKAGDDRRPESYKVDFDSPIECSGQRVPTANDWLQRRNWLEKHLVESFEELEQRRQTSGETLGVLRCSRLVKLHITPVKEPEWTENEKAHLMKEGLFEQDEKGRPLLKKLPFDFHYDYECETNHGVENLRHKIIDWEAGALYWNCVHRYGTEWEKYFRNKLEDEFFQKDLMFLMGTMHRFPSQWLIVGLIYPPKPAPDSGQLTLL